MSRAAASKGVLCVALATLAGCAFVEPGRGELGDAGRSRRDMEAGETDRVGSTAAGVPSQPAPSSLELVEILPRDAIPAIDRPSFWSAEEAASHYPDDMLVLGVALDGDARAYSIPFLSRHEIVNDRVGGHAIAATW